MWDLQICVFAGCVPLEFHMNFRTVFFIATNVLDRDGIKSALDGIYILALLSLMSKHRMSIYLGLYFINIF